MNRVEIKTAEYEFSHGGKPRGRGYWGFQIGSDREHVVWSNPNQLYSQAVADARKLALSWHADFVKVLP